MKLTPPLMTTLLAVSLLTIFSGFSADGQKLKYNVLFIAVDDLRPDLGCYGNEMIKSPNIDALASEGIVFTRAYCQQAICMASRASILTGMLPERRGLFKCGPVNRSYPDHPKLDDLFRENGYQVKAYGKIYHHSNDHRKQFGDKWMGNNPRNQTHGRGYIDPASINRIYDDAGRGPAFENPDVSDNAYFDGYQAEEVVLSLDEYSKTGDPFFLALGFKKPHLPFNAPKKYWDLYNRDELDLPAIQNLPDNYTEHTIYNFGELRNYNGIPKGENDLPHDLQKTLKHGYYACVSYIDAQLGKVLQKLEETGLDKNTIVVLWGDHGWKLGEHGMWCKHTNFELDTRVPLIIKVPGQEPARPQSFVELVDLYPTLADLCNLEIPRYVDGKSLVEVMKNPDKQRFKVAYSMFPHHRNNDDKLVIGYSVVNDRFRYIRWIHLDSGQIRGEELYDHSIDPGENENVAGLVKNKRIIKEMKGLLDKRWVMNDSILQGR